MFDGLTLRNPQVRVGNASGLDRASVAPTDCDSGVVCYALGVTPSNRAFVERVRELAEEDTAYARLRAIAPDFDAAMAEVELLRRNGLPLRTALIVVSERIATYGE